MTISEIFQKDISLILFCFQTFLTKSLEVSEKHIIFALSLVSPKG